MPSRRRARPGPKWRARDNGVRSAWAPRFSRIWASHRSACSPRRSLPMSALRDSASRSCRLKQSMIESPDPRSAMRSPVPPADRRYAGANDPRMERRMLAALIWTITAGTVALLAAAAIAAPRSALLFADKSPSALPVDVELVLAVDVSYSMDPEEQALQREGYITGITSREFLHALRAGMHGKVAVTYFEWAGPYDQKIIVPWRLIDGPETADAFANEIARAPYRRASRTSISGALNFAKPLFDASGYRGFRRVVDVSGDGANNSGPFVTVVRDDLLAAGITINGLPIVLKRPNSFTMDIENLDVYYEDCVIGGPGAFVIPIRERDQFKEATRNKLVLEIAGRSPKPSVIPAQARRPRISCTIGEEMRRQRWGG